MLLSKRFSRPWDVPPGTWSISPRHLLLLLLTAMIIFPIYTAGFGLWHKHFNNSSWCIDADRLQRWPQELTIFETPAQIPNSHAAWVNANGSWTIRSAPQQDNGLLVHLPHHARVVAGRRNIVLEPSSQPSSQPSSFRLAPGAAASVSLLAPGDSVRIEGQGTISLGSANDAPLPYEATRGISWLLWFIITQLVLIALPEEFFYRGYLQHRLQHFFRRKLILWGGDIGPAVLVTSAIFALGHFLTIPSPYRLAVFFPSLLFGWLKDKTGSIWIPTIFHLLSNLLLEILGHMLC